MGCTPRWHRASRRRQRGLFIVANQHCRSSDGGEAAQQAIVDKLLASTTLLERQPRLPLPMLPPPPVGPPIAAASLAASAPAAHLAASATAAAAGRTAVTTAEATATGPTHVRPAPNTYTITVFATTRPTSRPICSAPLTCPPLRREILALLALIPRTYASDVTPPRALSLLTPSLFATITALALLAVGLLVWACSLRAAHRPPRPTVPLPRHARCRGSPRRQDQRGGWYSPLPATAPGGSPPPSPVFDHPQQDGGASGGGAGAVTGPEPARQPPAGTPAGLDEIVRGPRTKPPNDDGGGGGDSGAGGRDGDGRGVQKAGSGAETRRPSPPADAASRAGEAGGDAPVVVAEKKKPRTGAKGWTAVVGRGSQRTPVAGGRELVQQGERQGWDASVAVPGEPRLRKLWEVLLDLLGSNGTDKTKIILVSDCEEIEVTEAIDRLAVGGLLNKSAVIVEQDAESLLEVLSRLAAVEAPGLGQEVTPHPAGATLTGGGTLASAAPSAARGAAPPAGHAARPQAPSPGPPRTRGAMAMVCLDEDVITGRGRRPMLPKTGVLPRRSVEAFFGYKSPFSNLNDMHGQVVVQVHLLPQVVIDVLGHENLQTVRDVPYGAFATVEHGLHFFKALIHGKNRLAMDLVREPNVWDVMRRGREPGWGFNWQLWDAVAYEVLLGLLRMKAQSCPQWLRAVAAHADVYFVEAAATNTNFGAGRHFDRLFDTEMYSLGHNFSGAALDEINDEHMGTQAFVPAVIVEGSQPVDWRQLSEPLSRRRDISERARHYRGEEAATSHLRPQALSPGKAPYAGGPPRSWNSSPSQWGGHGAKAQRLAPSPGAGAGYGHGGHGPPSPPSPPPRSPVPAWPQAGAMTGRPSPTPEHPLPTFHMNPPPPGHHPHCPPYLPPGLYAGRPPAPPRPPFGSPHPPAPGPLTSLHPSPPAGCPPPPEHPTPDGSWSEVGDLTTGMTAQWRAGPPRPTDAEAPYPGASAAAGGPGLEGGQGGEADHRSPWGPPHRTD